MSETSQSHYTAAGRCNMQSVSVFQQTAADLCVFVLHSITHVRLCGGACVIWQEHTAFGSGLKSELCPVSVIN
jgi:hypothetical protein